MENFMVMQIKPILKDLYIKVIGELVLKMDREKSFGMMEVNMKDLGKMICKMDKEPS
jgi:hypothetical protein